MHLINTTSPEDQMQQQRPFQSDRRSWARVPCEAETLLLKKDAELAGAIASQQSIGGVQISVQDDSVVKLHRQLRVIRDGIARDGIVRWMNPHETSGFRVGIEWLDLRQQVKSYGKPVADYLCFGETLVVCFVRRKSDDGSAIIDLPDGSTWKVVANTLTSRTVHERKSELVARDEDRSRLARLYQVAEEKKSSVATIEGILDFEFSSDGLRRHTSPMTGE